MIDRLNTSLTILLTALVLFISTTMAPAQETPTGQQTPPPEQTAPPADPTSPLKGFDTEAIQQRIGELQQLDQEDEAVKTELDLLQRTLSSLQEYEADQQAIADFQSRASTAPQRLKQIQEELTVPIEDAIPALPESGTLEELTGLLMSAQNQHEAVKTLHVDIEDELNTRTSRLSTIPEFIAQTTQSLEPIDEALQNPSDPDDESPITLARRQNLQARKLALETKLDRLNEETKSYNARSDMIRLRRDHAQRKVTVAERYVQLLQDRVDALRQTEAEQTRREADAARRAAANANSVVREITELTAQFAEENKRVTDLITETNTDHQDYADQITYWTSEFEKIRIQEQQFGLNEVMGIRLRSQQLNLPRQHALKNQLHQIKDEIRVTQGATFVLDSGIILDLTGELERRFTESAEQIPPDQPEDIMELALEALTAQAVMRRDLLKTHDDFLQALTTMHHRSRELEKLVGEFNAYINQHILWIQSADPLSLSSFFKSGRAAEYSLNREHWLAAIVLLRDDARDLWPLYVSFLILYVGLLLLRPQVRRALIESGKHVSRVTTDRFLYTIQAFSSTLLLSLTWPVLFWFLGRRMGRTPVMNDFVAAAADAFVRVGSIIFLIALIRWLCIPGGLAEAHFQWRSTNLKKVRHHIRWFVPVILPLAFISLLLKDVSQDAHRDSLGRLTFMIAMVFMSLFSYWILNPKTGVFGYYLSNHPGSWMNRCRFIWFPLLVFSPIGFLVTAGFGYAYTATELLQRLVDTAAMLLFILIIHSLLLRWLIVVQRRLAVAQAEKKRGAATDSAKAEAETRAHHGERAADAPATVSRPALKKLDVDVDTISVQTRRMLTSGITLASFLFILMIWADVLPAFKFLSDAHIAGMMTTQVVNGESVQVPLTLADVAGFLIVLIVLFIVNRNLTGLMEIVFLQRLPISAGARYAIVTLSRYAIIIVGIGVAFDQIGIGWSQVQWLAAAITVGLGFGLQEIFANFVSGIILLFERPVRVGDTVTVGKISGTVTRIQMRATTITDWDRKELIIPNKEFITGQIINWSLTNTILRVRIPVGIARGSDREKALRLLFQCAEENERILDDPAPQALFISFGDSTLELELRAYIPSIDHSVPVKHELHNAIDQAFREAKIEIAFPQRDLNIRNITSALEVVGDRRVPGVET